MHGGLRSPAPPAAASKRPIAPADRSPLFSAAAVETTAASIETCQLPSGLILWFEGGHADPWNHVEAAMALTVAGRHKAAEAAFGWLAGSQLPNGAWHNYYTAAGVEDAKFDTNCCAYVATGVWHRLVATGDRAFAEAMWPTVERALDWVVSLRRPSGHIPWAVHTDGSAWSYSLLTGSSSIALSLRCGAALAEQLGHERPDWELAALRLNELVAEHPEEFEPKHRWAMDWYYPVLVGAVEGRAAVDRLTEGAGRFVLGGRGVRCVADKTWVTTAETCECAIAHARAGMVDAAWDLFGAVAPLRQPDGSYLTGVVQPEGNSFPAGEHTTYSAAAVLLAADALGGLSPAASVLTSSPEQPEGLTS